MGDDSRFQATVSGTGGSAKGLGTTTISLLPTLFFCSAPSPHAVFSITRGVKLGLPNGFREGKATCSDIGVVGGDREASGKILEKIGNLGPLAIEVVVVTEGDPGIEGWIGKP